MQFQFSGDVEKHLEIKYILQQNVSLPNYTYSSYFRDWCHSHSNWPSKARTRVWYLYHSLFCYQSFQKCVFLYQTRKARSQTVTMVRMWSDDIIQWEWVSAPTQSWQRKELCFNIVHIVTGFIKGNTSGWQYVASSKPLELKAWVPSCCALWAEEHKPTSWAPGVLRTACPKFSASQSEWISPVAKVQLFWH